MCERLEIEVAGQGGAPYVQVPRKARLEWAESRACQTPPSAIHYDRGLVRAGILVLGIVFVPALLTALLNILAP